MRRWFGGDSPQADRARAGLEASVPPSPHTPFHPTLWYPSPVVQRMASSSLTVHQIYAGVLGTGAIVVSLYACILYQRKLQLRRHQMYMDTFVRAIETLTRLRRSR